MHEQVVAAARGMFAAGLVTGTAGNVSARLDGGHALVTPAAVPYDELTPGDLVVLDLATGAIVAGTRRPTSEWALHVECLRRFPEVGAVLHSHPPGATAFACARRPVPALIDELVLHSGGEIPCAEYAPSGTSELARNAADRLADVGSALLANHGMVTVAATPAEALRQAAGVEHAARVALAATALGGYAGLPADVVARFAAGYRAARRGR